MERWKPTVACKPQEQRLLKLAGKSRKLFVFLREHRRELFDDSFQDELETMYWKRAFKSAGFRSSRARECAGSGHGVRGCRPARAAAIDCVMASVVAPERAKLA